MTPGLQMKGECKWLGVALLIKCFMSLQLIFNMELLKVVRF